MLRVFAMLSLLATASSLGLVTQKGEAGDYVGCFDHLAAYRAGNFRAHAKTVTTVQECADACPNSGKYFGLTDPAAAAGSAACYCGDAAGTTAFQSNTKSNCKTCNFGKCGNHGWVISVYQFASQATTTRTCDVADNWRYKWLGSHVEINDHATVYGGETTWSNCLAECRADPKCKQTVLYGPNGDDTGYCYAMNEASSLDQDNKGGSNADFKSAHCSDTAPVTLQAYATGDVVEDDSIEVGTSDFTITMKVTPSAMTYGMLAAMDKAGDGIRQFRLEMYSSGVVAFVGEGILSSGSNSWGDSNSYASNLNSNPVRLTAGTTYQISLTREGKVFKLYVNDDVSSYTTGAVEMMTKSTDGKPFRIGSRTSLFASGSVNVFQGVIASPKFFDRALTASEIDAEDKASSGGSGSAAKGDPHLMNLKGEAFDVMQTGNMMLLEIPRRSSPATLDLALHADIERLGVVSCGPTFITSTSITGRWIGVPLEIRSGPIATEGRHQPKHTFAIRFDSKAWLPHAEMQRTMELSKDATITALDRMFLFQVRGLDIAVSQPKRPRIFLDIQVKGLGNLKTEIGGLLGIDDHSSVEELPSECEVSASSLSLVATRNDEALQWSARALL